MWYAERVSLPFPISTIAVVKTNERRFLSMTTSVSLFDNHRHEGAALLLSARLLLPVSFSTGGVSGCRPCTGIRMAPAMAGNPLPKITPAAREDKSKSTTTPFTTHDWPVISHYYVHLCAKVLAGAIVGVRSPIRHHAELSGLCRYTRLDTFEDFVVVVVVLGLARVYEIEIESKVDDYWRC